MYAKQSEELSRATLNSMQVINYTTSAVYGNPYQQSQWKMDDGRGGIEDLSWLL
jgi:hypothetical protein